ncbi:hypothetical protein [Methanosarcina spelaei]|nr:hypothetical protein [Methanosarcina spelaei]
MIIAKVNLELRKIITREIKRKALLKGTPIYSAAHKMEHLEKGEVKRIPI